MRYELMSALVLAATVGACGDRATGRESTSVPVSTIDMGSADDIAEACAKFEIQEAADDRPLFQRRADAMLAGCPEHLLPPFDPEAE